MWQINLLADFNTLGAARYSAKNRSGKARIGQLGALVDL
jgi:hypothetical protein